MSQKEQAPAVQTQFSIELIIPRDKGESRKKIEAATRLFRKPPNAEGNWEPNDNHVDKQPKNKVVEFVRAPGVKRGERQNDKIHDLFHRGAKEQTAHQRVLRHKTQLAACRVVNSRCRASNKEVQCDTKNIGADASLESLPPRQCRHPRRLPVVHSFSPMAQVQNLRSSDPLFHPWFVCNSHCHDTQLDARSPEPGSE